MKIKECISTIGSFSGNKKKKKSLLDSVHPAVTRLRDGERIFKLLEEIVYGSEYYEAAEFLERQKWSSRLWPFSRIGWWLLLWVFMYFISIMTLFYGFSEFYIAKQSTNWPKTSGVIHKAEVKQYSDDDGTYFKAEVVYGYRVNGVSYTSSRRTFNEISYGINIGGETIIGNLVSRYPLDSSVMVYYNPKDPGMAVLENRDVPYSRLIPTMVLGFILLTLTLVFSVIQVQGTQCHECRRYFVNRKIKMVKNGYSEKYNYQLYSNLYECIKCGFRWKGRKYGIGDD